MSAPDGLMEEVVKASGLVELIAPFTVSRLLISAGVSPPELTSDDLRRALPELERGLRVYLDEDQLEQALSRLERLAGP